MRKPLKIGVGGPVGSGKTALLDCLCKSMRDRYQLGVVTNDIFTREDMEFLMRSQALPSERIIGVETVGCPHTAIREALYDGSAIFRPLRLKRFSACSKSALDLPAGVVVCVSRGNGVQTKELALSRNG